MYDYQTNFHLTICKLIYKYSVMYKINKYLGLIYFKIVNYIFPLGRFSHLSNLTKTQNDDFFQLFKKGIIG